MNICVFGDSITWGACDYARRLGRASQGPLHGAGRRYQRIQHGRAGDHSEGLRRRFLNEATLRNPNIVIFAIGINGSKINRAAGQSRVGLGQFRDNLATLADEAAGLGARVIFIGLTRVDEALKASPALMPERYYDNAHIIVGVADAMPAMLGLLATKYGGEWSVSELLAAGDEAYEKTL